MNTDTHTIEAAPEPDKHAVRREILDLVKLAVFFLLVFWVIKSFIVEGYEVQGESMAPTLADRDRILVFKLPHELSKIFLFSRIQPFDEKDIIVFEGEGRKRLVKRIIAYNPRQGGGNKVDAKHLDGDELARHSVKVEFDKGVVRVNDWQIDESAYLPEAARTSRDRKVCMLKPGEYYVLGDHRQVSKDSRSFSAISDEQIIGRAVLRFWPISKIGFL